MFQLINNQSTDDPPTIAIAVFFGLILLIAFSAAAFYLDWNLFKLIKIAFGFEIFLICIVSLAIFSSSKKSQKKSINSSNDVKK
jgi:hypothetical protein